MKKNIRTDEINGEKVFVRVGWYQMAVRFCDAEGKTKKQKPAKWHDDPTGRLFWVHSLDGQKQGMGYTLEDAKKNFDTI